MGWAYWLVQREKNLAKDMTYGPSVDQRPQIQLVLFRPYWCFVIIRMTVYGFMFPCRMRILEKYCSGWYNIIAPLGLVTYKACNGVDPLSVEAKIPTYKIAEVVLGNVPRLGHDRREVDRRWLFWHPKTWPIEVPRGRQMLSSILVKLKCTYYSSVSGVILSNKYP